MTKTKVALLGATGETGGSILNGLLEDGEYDISLLTRPSSLEKPATKAFAEQGLQLIPIDLTSEIDPNILRGFDVVISAIGPLDQSDQLRLATATAAAGVKRFVPCSFITVCPPGGIMILRDAKEEVFNHIFKLHLGYTIIDVGFWHQISIVHLPSGRADSTLFLKDNYVYGDGQAPNILTDLRDIGRFVARIVKDPRTLNKKVLAWSDELSQREIYEIAERLSGETIPKTNVSEEQLDKTLADARAAMAEDPKKIYHVFSNEYNQSKYIRRDNTRENALYLGYLDAKELYPDFKPITFEDCFREVISGKIKKPYENRNIL